jgi:photosystem II stability/assembly factor-like uncharacterized protein
MQKFYILLFLALLSSTAFSQNKAEYFKLIPQLKESDPQWVKMMYSENPNVDEVVNAYQEYYRNHKFKKNIHTQNYKFWLRNIEPLVNAQGFIDASGFNQRLAALQAAKKKNTTKTQIWSSMGPYKTCRNDGSGDLRTTQVNVYGIAVAPSNHSILYCITETGGVFKTTDKALNWFPVSMDESFTNGQDLKIHPSNPAIVYLATGNKIYKTTNSGSSWNLVYTATSTVEQLLIHPARPDSIYAATASGLWLTTDGGQNWTNKLNKRCWDIRANPGNPNTLYVSIHNTTAKRAEIYKTYDFGNNWTLMDSNWYVPTNLQVATDIGCKIGITPADTNRIYTCLIGNSKSGDQEWIGVYYSNNGATSWINPDSIDGGPYVPGMNKNTNWYVAGYSDGYNQGWYNFDLDVSTQNADRIWMGTIWVLESDNKGKNIEYIRGTRNLPMHADVQDIEVVGNEIWYASDGGVNYSNNEMLTVDVRNNGLFSSDFWGFGQGWNEDTWTGGRYHNGDAVYHENYGLGNTIFQGGAEKSTGYINPVFNRHCYYSDITDKLTPDSIGKAAKSVSDISKYPNESYWLLNSSELEFDPVYADIMYLGSDNSFYKSTNGGASFTPLFSWSSSARVLEFEVARSNPDTIYVLVRKYNTGKIYRSVNGGSSFSAITNIPSNSLSKLDLTLDPQDAAHLWVSSYYGANGQKVYETTDGGQTWTNRTTSALDNQQILDIVFQAGTDNLVYIATEYGLFYWDNNNASWVNYGSGLPFVTKALKLIPFYRDGKLRLASSRGIWEAPLAENSDLVVRPMTVSKDVYCSRDTVYFEDYSVVKHDSVSWHWSFSPAPLWIDSPNKRNPKVLFANGSYDVTLSITDQKTNTTKSATVQNMIVVNSMCEPDTVPGLAMNLSAAGDFASVPDLNLAQCNHFTVTAWIKIKGEQPAYSAIIMNNGTAAGFNFRNDNEMGYHWPGGQWWWNSGLKVDSNEWAYVAMVATPDSMTLYLNGVASVHKINLNPVDIGSLDIGSYNGWASRNMKGEIDEVCIWNRALSQDEIRELRHLTRNGNMPYSDSLVAYYQFNLSGISKISDRISTHHAVLTGGAQKIASDVPVGGGESMRMQVSANNTYSFGSTGVQMTTGTSAPEGEVVATHLRIQPNVVPNTGYQSGEYWIINNYGNTNFNALDSLMLSYFNTTPQTAISGIKLYTRGANDDQNTWSQLCGPVSMNSGWFRFDNSCGIKNFGQFFIPFDKSVSIEESVAGDYRIYPNPTRGKFTLQRDGNTDKEVIVELYDITSRQMMSQRLEPGQDRLLFDISGFSKGVYFLRIQIGNERLVKMITKE